MDDHSRASQTTSPSTRMSISSLLTTDDFLLSSNVQRPHSPADYLLRRASDTIPPKPKRNIFRTLVPREYSHPPRCVASWPPMPQHYVSNTSRSRPHPPPFFTLPAIKASDQPTRVLGRSHRDLLYSPPSTNHRQPLERSYVASASGIPPATRVPPTTLAQPRIQRIKTAPLPSYEFTLTIRQQPKAARACGYGDRDRRVIDPPPILELRVTDPSTKARIEDSSANFVLSCELVTAESEDDGNGNENNNDDGHERTQPHARDDNQDSNNDDNHDNNDTHDHSMNHEPTGNAPSPIPTPSSASTSPSTLTSPSTTTPKTPTTTTTTTRQTPYTNLPACKLLIGSTSITPSHARDDYGVPGTFFVFADLSCRTAGRYRLKFSLVRLTNLPQWPTGGEEPAPGTTMAFPIVATQRSDVFVAYSPKDFPGMRASSALLCALRGQGLNVGLKKGGRRRKRGMEREDEDGDGDGEEEVVEREIVSEDEDDEEISDEGRSLPRAGRKGRSYGTDRKGFVGGRARGRKGRRVVDLQG